MAYQGGDTDDGPGPSFTSWYMVYSTLSRVSSDYMVAPGISCSSIIIPCIPSYHCYTISLSLSNRQKPQHKGINNWPALKPVFHGVVYQHHHYIPLLQNHFTTIIPIKNCSIYQHQGTNSWYKCRAMYSHECRYRHESCGLDPPKPILLAGKTNRGVPTFNICVYIYNIYRHTYIYT